MCFCDSEACVPGEVEGSPVRQNLDKELVPHREIPRRFGNECAETLIIRAEARSG